jgi:hypothetical protein
MNDIKITITGLGGTLGFTVKIIEELLKKEGYQVAESNDIYHTHSVYNRTVEEYRAMGVDDRKRKVTIISVDIPWGG